MGVTSPCRDGADADGWPSFQSHSGPRLEPLLGKYGRKSTDGPQRDGSSSCDGSPALQLQELEWWPPRNHTSIFTGNFPFTAHVENHELGLTE